MRSFHSSFHRRFSFVPPSPSPSLPLPNPPSSYLPSSSSSSSSFFCFFQPYPEATNNIYGWDRVPAFNAILKDNMPLLLPSSSSRSSRFSPPLLLDVERQGTLRSDARLKPNVDCLHICPTGIAEDWGRWIGMVMRGEEGWGE